MGVNEGGNKKVMIGSINSMCGGEKEDYLARQSASVFPPQNRGGFRNDKKKYKRKSGLLHPTKSVSLSAPKQWRIPQ